MHYFGGGIGNGGGYTCVGAGGMWGFIVPSPQVCYESKTVLKNEVYYKKRASLGFCSLMEPSEVIKMEDFIKKMLLKVNCIY